MPPRNFLHEAQGLISIPPLGIAHLSSFLKKFGHFVDLDDLDIKVISNKNIYNKMLDLQKEYTSDDLEKYLQSEKNAVLDEISNILFEMSDFNGFEMVGFSLIETSAKDVALLLSKKIKETTGAKIVFGGQGVSSELSVKYSFVDYVIIGNGEKQFLELINTIENTNNAEKIKENAEKITKTFPQTRPDFSTLPFDCYRNVPEENGFYNPGRILILPYLWSINCPYKCSFCGSSLNTHKIKIFNKPVLDVFEDLKSLSKEYNTRYFFNLNSYLHVDKKHTLELCDKIIDEKLSILFCGCLRCNIEPELIASLAKAGCFYATFGVESGSDRILQKMAKGYNSKTAENSIKLAHNSNMWVSIYIIVGFPNETDNDFKETFDFIDRNIGYIDQINVCPFYLVDSAVLRFPDRFGIKIRQSIGKDVHSDKSRYAYDEINGLRWEEIEKKNKDKLNKLFRLFYGIYRKMPEKIYRRGTYQLFYAFDKFKDKNKVHKFLKEAYKKELSLVEKEIHITDKCNNKCEFCRSPEEVYVSMDKLKNELINLKVKGIKRIIISGGEPTMHSDLFEIIRIIYGFGFEIKLKTNARMIYYKDFSKKLADYGVKTISVPIYSKYPDAHDSLTGVKGSFMQTIAGINNWKKLGGEVEIRTKIVEGKNEDMAEFVDFIMGLETRLLW